MKRLMTELIAVLALLVVSGPAAADVAAPNSLVFVSCRVDDLTGQPGRQDPAMAARNWRDLELHINGNQEYECKRELITNVEDSSQFGQLASADLIPLTPNFGNPGTCARIGVTMAVAWDQEHPGWSVVAIGCPTPIVSSAGDIVGWQLPSCPTYLPGTNNRMKCVFDESVI